MQVLPRFVSVEEDGTEHEFLADYFRDKSEALSMVFLKGYQWPFDSRKVMTGSSIIDLLVYRENVLKKRRVYLDFTKNPFGMTEIDYQALSFEAYEYLRKAGACFGTPIERLLKMNSPAVDLYRGKGVDITREYLEIALCAQHHNGGIAVDKWWQTCVPGLYAAGECAGTHGITRPGGSALNAGQVGSLRAALYLSSHPNRETDEETFTEVLAEAETRHTALGERISHNPDNVETQIAAAQRRMSDKGAAIRKSEAMAALLAETESLLKMLPETVGVKDAGSMYRYYTLRDLLITQSAVLTAMLDYAHTNADTRGSALCYHERGELREGLEDMFRFVTEKGNTRDKVQQIFLTENGFACSIRPVRPIPQDDDFFENVWRVYRENGNVY
jgi:succinate dehydrogenase/fumarate reductase flavoprotein subunit